MLSWKIDKETQATLREEHRLRLERSKRMVDIHTKHMRNAGKTRLGDFYENMMRSLYDDEDDRYVHALFGMKRIPVSIQEFIESSDFVGGLDMEIWPQIKRDIIEVCPDILLGETPVKEYIDSGATGTGKTLKASIVQAYQLYLLHCFNSPQRFFGQAETTPIVFTMASSNLSTTYNVLFRPFRDIVTGMRFFRTYTKWNRERVSTLDFDNRVKVEPVAATNQGIIGRAVISGHVDEANYMQVVAGSARAEHTGRGVYDQAEQFYKQLTLRRRSRFSSTLPVPGLIILSSSIRHNDDFLERRIDQARTTVVKDPKTGNDVQGEPGVKIFRHKQFEVQPADRFDDETFDVLVGTPEYPTRILTDEDERGVTYPDDARVEPVPMNYYMDFLHRPEDALRDVLGIGSVSLTPFITQRNKIVEAWRRWEASGQAHPVRRANVDLVEHGMPVIDPDLLDPDETTPRFAHIDLSKTKDRCGIVVLRVDKLEAVETERGVRQILPFGVVELAVSIQPSQAKELDIAAVRDWVVALKTVHRVPIYSITYDGYNSAESIQAIRALGIRSSVISMDKDDAAYMNLRRSLYQDRIMYPNNEILVTELTQLDKDETTGKIDHPAKGSKDISDALAGAWYAAVRSRAIRTQLHYVDEEGNRVADR